MVDEHDSDSPPNSSSSSSESASSPWAALGEALGTSDPSEALARVQAMKRELNRSGSQEADEEGLVTISEVEEVFREMNEKIDRLRERNADLAERLEDEDEDLSGAFRDLHQKTEQLLDTLDASTMDEARERIRKLNQRIEALYREKETLVQAGFSDADEAVHELERLREERKALKQERDRLQENSGPSAPSDPDSSLLEAATLLRDRLGIESPDDVKGLEQAIEEAFEHVRARAAPDAPDDSPDSVLDMLGRLTTHLDALPAPDATDDSDLDLPAEVGDILGIRTVDEARELERLIENLSDQLDRLRHEQQKLEEADLTVDAALTMIENMEAQLVDLYHGPDLDTNGTSDADSWTALDESLKHRIRTYADVSPHDDENLSRVVRTLLDQLDERSAECDLLAEAGLDAEKAVTMIESMEAQLEDLYRTQEEQGEAAVRLAAIDEVLGISTRAEAEELSEIARQMEHQLTDLYQEKEKLQALGLSSIEDAVEMIESMEEQLADLYEDKEALRALQREETENQSTFQQLEALYAEQEKLQRELGVSSAADVIEMVKSLTTQLDELYEERDAEVSAAADAGPSAPHSSPTDDGGETETVLSMSSMEHQLKALYREKETLLHHGLSNAQEAVNQLQAQQEKIDALQRENHSYERRFERLQSELGTANVPQVVDAIRALETDADTSVEEVLDTTSPAEAEYSVDIDATSPLVSDETLDRLDDMPPTELNELDVGVVRLSDDGTVEYLNDAAFQLPGLPSVEDQSTVIGRNFFLDLAPSTNNDLFFGRFQRGQRRGVIDARFPYTFISPNDDPHSFAVHLHRNPDAETTWLLFRPA